MKRSPHHLKHEQKKAIRKSQKEEVYQTDKKEMTAREKKKYLSSPHCVKISEAKLASKHKHHMTSPKEVDWQTEPKSTHPEGLRWMRTIQRQTLSMAVRLRKKLQKFPFFGRKK